MPFLQLVTIVVDDYDPAIEFFVGVDEARKLPGQMLLIARQTAQ